MNIRERGKLKQAARAAVNAVSYDPRKLILIHTGVTLGVSLVLSLISHLLQQQMADTGGLSGVGTRAVLETAQTVLMLAQMAALLFWEIGFTYAALSISRRQDARPGSLLEGFRRFGPVLRLRLMSAFLVGGMAFLSFYASAALFTFTPFANPLSDAITAGTEEALMAAMEQVTVPLMLIVCAVMLVLVVPYWYRLRMAEYVLLDDPKGSAMRAIRQSRLLMHRNRAALLRLDLSFWWFYALQALTVVVSYGDLLLPAFGISLPWSETVSYYVFLILCYGCQLLLYRWKGSHLQVTYAMAYQALRAATTDA